MRRILVLGVAVILSGCAIPLGEGADRAQREMVGMPKARVLACMGAPDAKAESEGTEVWTYHTGGSVSNNFGVVNRYGVYGGTSVNRFCKVDVILDRDKVSRINYSGQGSIWAPNSECYYAVGNCLGS